MFAPVGRARPLVTFWCACGPHLFPGYQYLSFTTPSIYAPNHEDIAVFFDTENWYREYTARQILKAAWPQLRFLLMAVASIAAPCLPILLFIFYMNRFEPMEQTMDRDEYWKNFRS